MMRIARSPSRPPSCSRWPAAAATTSPRLGGGASTSLARAGGGGETLALAAPEDGSLKFDKTELDGQGRQGHDRLRQPVDACRTPSRSRATASRRSRDTVTGSQDLGHRRPRARRRTRSTALSATIVPRAWRARSPSGERTRHGVGAEVEDRRKVARHEQAARELAERPVGEDVAHGVAHQRAAVAVGDELVGVVPESVGPAQLGVDEAQAGVPLLDAREPGGPARRAGGAGTRSGRRRASRAGAAVTIRKRSQSGVIASRLPASAKKGKTASGGAGEPLLAAQDVVAEDICTGYGVASCA